MADEKSHRTLAQLGERQIVSEIIGKYFAAAHDPQGVVVGFGDDAAVLEAPPKGRQLVLTTDPCPTPAVCMVDPEARDLFQYGWMTVVINLSDLAAMGARPLGLVVSTVMPERLRIHDYERFLEGIKAASDKWGCNVLGGNIKDGPNFTATAAALGHVLAGCEMRRTGAREGDVLLVCGPSGFFWAGILQRLLRQRGNEIDLDASDAEAIEDAVERPTPRINEGWVLAESGLVTACMDNSDGVVACLLELAIVNQVELVVELKSLQPPASLERLAIEAEIDPRVLMLSWGDWQLVCTSSADDAEHVRRLMSRVAPACPCLVVGQVLRKHGTGRVLIRGDAGEDTMPDFSSKRFHGTSIFTHGLNSYLKRLRDVSELFRRLS